MASVKQTETRQGVELTNLDQPLFGGAEASKRDLIDYLEHTPVLVGEAK